MLIALIVLIVLLALDVLVVRSILVALVITNECSEPNERKGDNECKWMTALEVVASFTCLVSNDNQFPTYHSCYHFLAGILL